MCGKLLVAVMPDLLAALERHQEITVTPEVREALLSISPATVDRLLHPFRLRHRRQPFRPSPASGKCVISATPRPAVGPPFLQASPISNNF